MRHLPLASLALAIASLFPATVSAHNHPTRLATRDLRHPQRPQPATFQPSPIRHGTRSRPTPHPPARAVRHGANRTSTRSTGSLRSRSRSATPPRSRRARLLAASTRGRRISGRPANLRVATIDQPPSPRELTPVVSIIRSTPDHPQLPPIQQTATQSTLLPSLYNDQGRLVIPAALVGSHEILIRQNVLADQDGLGRVQDDADLDAMRTKRMLVPLPASNTLHVDDRLPSNRRFCRAWTAQFLTNLSRAHYARFGTPLQVNSAVRTVAFQLRLQRTNGNAAPAEGDTASPHLTGQAIDIAKRGLSLPEIAWLRGYLLPLIQEGRVDVEEEFQQSCFHISVYRRYLPLENAPQRYTVTSRNTDTLAAIIPTTPR